MTKKSHKNTLGLHLLCFWLVAALVFSIFGSLFPCEHCVAGGNQLSGLVSSSKADLALQLGRGGSRELHPGHFSCLFLYE